MRIGSLDDVQSGDIMISGMSTAPTKIIVYGGQFLLREHFRVGEFVAGHAGVVTPGYKLVEAMPSGARERDLRDTDWSSSHAYFRIPDDYPGQHLDAAALAKAMIGTPYSLLSYGYLAAYLAGLRSERLADHINRRRSGRFALPSGRFATDGVPIEAICSVLSEQAWTLTGKKVIHGTRPQVVTPGMLAVQLWSRSDIIKGGPGIIGN